VCRGVRGSRQLVTLTGSVSVKVDRPPMDYERKFAASARAPSCLETQFPPPLPFSLATTPTGHVVAAGHSGQPGPLPGGGVLEIRGKDSYAVAPTWRGPLPTRTAGHP